jgi:hypothetical protein
VTRPTYSIRIDGVDALDLPVALMRDFATKHPPRAWSALRAC